ncbi:MAG: ABC-F family ATP-binding cassette domain-containing protein [Anaerolineae bacterium]|jgi:ATP-binding cassette subfamily F protein 3
MSLVSANRLGKSYGAQDVFAGVSFSIPRQAKIALLGPNGSGKTTLLRLVAGLEPPTTGVIQRARSARIAYLPQKADRFFDDDTLLRQAMHDVFADLLAQAAELERLEAAMADSPGSDAVIQQYGRVLEAFEASGGYTYEHRIEQVLAGLGFSEDDFQRPIGQLSGGQKTRALLARLLLEEPDVLLLDEPTNHLDLAGTEWLESHLASWDGAMVVVSHDRAFLDACVEEVWELSWGRLTDYRGNYSNYAVQRAERAARQEALYEQQQESIARTEDFIRRNIAGQRSREAKGRRKRLQRLERIQKPRAYRPMDLALYDADRSGDLVLGLHDLAVGYPGPDGAAEVLFTVGELELRRGQSVALLGPNGCGKTSLVRTIIGEIPPLAGRVRIGANVRHGYFAQGHTNLALEDSVIGTILDAGEMRISEARHLLARYHFFGDDVFKCVGDLSGGEQARVALALLVMQGANLLILDEPTNHLDIPSQEVLEEVLADFNGTALVVTHDRYLIRALASRIWAIDDGELRAFRGLEEYHDWREQLQQQVQRMEDKEGEQAASARMRARAQRRKAKREEERRALLKSELEERIHELEARQSALETQLAAASQEGPADWAVARVRELGLQYSEIERELDDLLVAWAEVA